MSTATELLIEFGSDPTLVTIRKSTRSTPIIADVLSIERDSRDEPFRVYLRCKIHGSNKDGNYKGWVPSGAISTILTKEDMGPL